MKRDSCIGNCNACLGACADREDVRLPAGSRVDRAILGNAVYILWVGMSSSSNSMEGDYLEIPEILELYGRYMCPDKRHYILDMSQRAQIWSGGHRAFV